MSRQTTRKSERESKKQIDAALKTMEKELLKASNPLDQLEVLNRAEDILEAEIFAWTEMLENESDCSEEEMENLVNSATPHIALLQDLIDKIAKFRVPLIDGAKAVYQARKNMGQSVGNIKHITHGNAQ